VALQWAATITDAVTRESEIQAAMEYWFDVDPAKASTWLASSGVPDEIKTRFLPPQG